MNDNAIEQAIESIELAIKMVKKYRNEPKNYDSEALKLIEKIYLELLKIADELKDINFLYVS